MPEDPIKAQIIVDLSGSLKPVNQAMQHRKPPVCQKPLKQSGSALGFQPLQDSATSRLPYITRNPSMATKNDCHLE